MSDLVGHKEELQFDAERIKNESARAERVMNNCLVDNETSLATRMQRLLLSYGVMAEVVEELSGYIDSREQNQPSTQGK